jgi:NodT family efflux transporter outer membrane factor (OMF) lipoprotein
MIRSSFFRGAAVAALLTAFGGCASGPERPRADFLDTPSVNRAVEQAQVREAGPSAWPEDEWWRRFHDSALDSVMARALANNRGLMRAAARLREAEGLVQVEGSRLLPFIDADMGMRQSRIPNHGVVASYNPELAGLEKTMGFINPLRLRYEFDFWGKNRAAVAAALGESAAEAAELAETRLLLTTSVARAYFRAAASARQAALARQIVDRRREYLRVTENAFRSGLETEDAVKTAIEELELANKREAAARALLAFQQDLLARLMGEGPDATRDLFARGTAPTTLRPLVVPAHLPIELLAHRPDLTAAMYRAEAAAERIHVAKAEFLPSVDLTAVSGLEASVTSTNAGKLASYLFRASAFNYQVMPGVHLPIFEGGRLRGRLEVRRGEYDEAAELYNETLLDAVRQVADGLANWRQTSSLLSAQDRLLAARRDQWKLAAGRWRSGLRDRRETLAIESGVLEQSYVRNGLEADHLAAVVDVIQALGGGYSSGVDFPRPRLAPEDSLAGLERLTPAWNFGAATSAAASLFQAPAATEPQSRAETEK